MVASWIRPATWRRYYTQVPRATKMAVRQNRPRRASGQDTAPGLSDTRSHPRISKTGTLTPATHATKAPDLIPGYRHSTKRLSPTNTAVRATVKQHTTKRRPEADSTISYS
ncbi:Hypothetical predicted protein [Pelobates cultripes]|uniref:Uncharacterized protein n=1 Tax=Pelobates cultripes TaxID=61616 RepID=A0AAD1SYA0_PELCU|nr:Hypothetical predicted protein [Pelobates cultripes]